MSHWEEAEFEEQQKSIKKWAQKKLWKSLQGRMLKRKLRKIQKLAGIATSDERTVVELSISRDRVLMQYGCMIDKTYKSRSVNLR